MIQQGLAQQHPSKKLWSLTTAGQDKGLEIWMRLKDTEKVLLLGMLQGVKSYTDG